MTTPGIEDLYLSLRRTAKVLRTTYPNVQHGWKSLLQRRYVYLSMYQGHNPIRKEPLEHLDHPNIAFQCSNPWRSRKWYLHKACPIQCLFQSLKRVSCANSPPSLFMSMFSYNHRPTQLIPAILFLISPSLLNPKLNKNSRFSLLKTPLRPLLLTL